MRETHARPGDAPETVRAAFALEHLGQHVARCSLTRQLWDANA